ncbi:DUF6901 family protein [Gynuella sunshinyii]|uniref:Uncharacterized protein n=1 Tax=Gynuella sunshinyii YC6258 TaxID=1445510 RepID=A0A0C5VPN1_9GAMM|nr:hypothetical protein [Gynuella sunshinyii]AJQ95358.1 hypothetical Protein YC6258_03322 [Gynuella sunshinyii YC6258]
MAIEYRFYFQDDEACLSYLIDPDNSKNSTTRASKPASWTELKNCQCSNCPLSAKDHKYCPAAVDMERVIEDFSRLPAMRKVDVHVLTPEREYRKVTGIEEGLRSLMGLIMAESNCPILSKLRPMAYTHLPFTNQSEFIIRSVGTYLLRQFYHRQSRNQADWDLKGLIALNQELRLVNQALWQRVNNGSPGDSNLKALLSFFAMSSSVSFSLEAQLAKVRPAFLEETDLGPFEGE